MRIWLILTHPPIHPSIIIHTMRAKKKIILLPKNRRICDLRYFQSLDDFRWPFYDDFEQLLGPRTVLIELSPELSSPRKDFYVFWYEYCEGSCIHAPATIIPSENRKRKLLNSFQRHPSHTTVQMMSTTHPLTENYRILLTIWVVRTMTNWIRPFPEFAYVQLYPVSSISCKI